MKTWSDYLADTAADDTILDQIGQEFVGEHDDEMKRQVSDTRRQTSALGRDIDRLVRRVERMAARPTPQA